MKKFTKLFLSCAAVAAVTAAVATSAMAADLAGVQYATDKNESGAELATGTVTITLPTEFKDATKTLLILKPGADKTNIATAKILQIGQDAYTGKVTAKVEALSADNADQTGTYTVLMGGTEGVIYEGSFRIGGSDRLLGDVEEDKALDAFDCLAIAKHAGGVQVITDNDTKLAADANDDAYIDAFDALDVAKKAANLTPGSPDYITLGTSTISDKHNQTIIEE